MNIIFGHEIAAQLREKYFVLELETFETADGETTAFCVLQPESVVLSDLPDMDRLQRLHQALIDSWNIHYNEQVMDIIPHLKGRFSGTMDSFYTELEDRIKKQHEHK